MWVLRQVRFVGRPVCRRSIGEEEVLMALEKIDAAALDPARTVVVATGNAHKLVEIEEILGRGFRR